MKIEKNIWDIKHSWFNWKYIITLKISLKNCKPNKMWVDKSSEFCNRLMKSWLEKMI